MVMFVRILVWFAVNAIFPIIIPVFFLAAVSWYNDGTFPFWKTFLDLINSGFYIFSASTLFFSLYEDYKEYNACIKPFIQTILVLMLIVSLFMFYKIHTGTKQYIEKHQLQFLITWLATAVFAVIAKYKILKYKN